MNSITSSSVDHREVEFYSGLADTWWAKDGPFWPLHRLNELRISWIVDRLRELALAGDSSQPLSGLKVLDIGCGGGILSESLARLGADVTGIDVVEKNIQVARAHASQSDLEIDYRLESAEALAAGQERFDVVFNMEVVEHVKDLPGYLAACHHLVKPGGATFIATINRNPLAWLVAIIGAEYILRWLPRGTHRYKLLRRPSEIKALVKRDGLLMRSVTGVAVNPFSRSMHLVGSTAVNYMLCAIRPVDSSDTA